jgi:hypothetical protein
MVECAYCERLLVCDTCQAEYDPANADQYRELSWQEQPVACPHCSQILVCHWCKTPYDGLTEREVPSRR